MIIDISFSLMAQAAQPEKHGWKKSQMGTGQSA